MAYPMKGWSKLDEEGKIPIPTNILRLTGFSPGDRMEIKVQGPNQRPWIVIHRREKPRTGVQSGY